MVRTLNRNALFLLSLALFVSGCERNAATSVALNAKPIAIVRDGKESIERGICGPPLANDSPTTRFDRVWEALPPRLKLDFPNQPGAFVVSADNASICRNEILRQSSLESFELTAASFDACWRPTAIGTGLFRPVVHLTKDPQAINNHLIPMTTTAFMEHYIDDVLGPASDRALIDGKKLEKGELQVRNFVTDVRRARELLAKAYVDDLNAANKPDILMSMTKRFHGTSGMLVQSIAFQNFVMAKFVDAYYCNASTVNTFNASELVRTRGAFLPFVDFLGAPWYVDEKFAAH